MPFETLGDALSSVEVPMESRASRNCRPNAFESLEFPELGAEAAGLSTGFAGHTVRAPADVMPPANAGHKPNSLSVLFQRDVARFRVLEF